VPDADGSKVYSVVFFGTIWTTCVVAAVLSGYIGLSLTQGSVLGTVAFAIGGHSVAVALWLARFVEFERVYKEDEEEDD
jgi:hypothetical protein